MNEKRPTSEDLPDENASTLRNPSNEEPVATVVCPTCGLNLPPSTRFCPNDATPINKVDPNRAVPGYQFIKLIGSGGMGDVYEAEHLTLKKRVAIKTLKSHLLETSAFRRFQTEARAASSLKHPNIVSVYDLGLSQTGEPYMVMDLVKGETLAQLLKRSGALSIDDSITIISQICAGVICAHERGILHRDLKPSNVILEQVGEKRVARVLDFGIAKILETDDLVSRMTRTGELLGTPSYMSPEQVNGQKLDHRSDIYSVGCMFYEMLTGSPPILGKSAMETMHRHVTEVPLPLSQAALKKFPVGLETIVARALAKDPADRFQTLKEMLSAIENYKKATIIRVKGPSLFESKIVNLGLLAVLLIGLAVAIVSITSNQSTNTSKPEPVSQAAPPATLEKSKGAKTHIVFSRPETDVMFKAVIQAHPNVTDITVDKLGDAEEFTDITDEALTPLKKFYQLGYLNLADCHNITAKGLENIVDLPNLRTLEIKDTYLGDEAMPLIARMKLTTLNLARTKVTDQGLLSFRSDGPLEDLNLKENKISDEGLKHIGKLRNLRKLCLDGCPSISDQGVAEISNLNLWALRLKGAGITSKVAKSLLRMKKLKELSIGETDIDDEGLLQLSKLKDLVYIEIQKCPRLTESGIEKFRRLSPKCRLITGKSGT
jgi:serine/threonine protein kinase